MPRILSLFAGLILLTSACASEQDQRIANSLDQISQITPDAGETPVAPQEVDCLEDSGVDMREVFGNADDATERVRLVGAIIECDLHLGDQFLRGFESSFEVGIGNGVNISRTESRCVVEDLVAKSDEPERILAGDFGEDVDGDLEILLAAIDLCFSEDNRNVVYGLDGFQNYGEDDRLDRLYDACSSGDMQQCDILFYVSAEGSEYRDLAFSCADREAATDSSCSVEGEIDPLTGFADPSSSALPGLVESCELGDMVSCDLLYVIAPLGSSFENAGFTCGGRIPIGGLPDCQTALKDA